MSYNNRGYRRNYGNSQQNYGSRQGGYQQNGNAPKTSGVVYTKIRKGSKEGLYAVNAWRKTKNGLMTATAMPKDGKEHESQDGTVYYTYSVEIVHRGVGTTQLYWALFNKSTRKIFIKELGLVISPNGNGYTRSGKRVSGYFGKAF